MKRLDKKTNVYWEIDMLGPKHRRWYTVRVYRDPDGLAIYSTPLSEGNFAQATHAKNELLRAIGIIQNNGWCKVSDFNILAAKTKSKIIDWI